MSGLHHFLIREGLRTRVSLVLETGEAREVHHFALLIGYGVQRDQPVPRLRDDRRHDRRTACCTGLDHRTACKNFVKAATKGVVKIMSKMGISTVQSYRGAQIFEAVGLRQDVIDEYFTLDAIAGRRDRHRGDRPGGAAAPSPGVPAARGRTDSSLDSGGQYQWRADGEHHLFNPETDAPAAEGRAHGQLRDLPASTATLVNDQSRHLTTLRGLLEFKPASRCRSTRSSRSRAS